MGRRGLDGICGQAADRLPSFKFSYGVRLAMPCRLLVSSEPDLRPSSMEKGSPLHNTRMADHANDSEEAEVCSTSRAGSFKEFIPYQTPKKGSI